jgi:hypothetical protein
MQDNYSQRPKEEAEHIDEDSLISQLPLPTATTRYYSILHLLSLTESKHLAGISVIFIVTLSLFLAFYYLVVIPPNFDIIENNLGRAFPGLATLLSIAIVLHNFVLNQQIKRLAREPKSFLSEVTKMLNPFLVLESRYQSKGKETSSTAFLYSDGLVLISLARTIICSLLAKAMDDANQLIQINEDRPAEDDDKSKDSFVFLNKDAGYYRKIKNISSQFIDASNYILKFIQTHRNHQSDIYTLLGFPIIHFMEKIIEVDPTIAIEKKEAGNKQINNFDKKVMVFFQSLLNLHSAKSTVIEAYIRSKIRKISYELIFSIIPVLVFIVLVGNITSTLQYSQLLLRIVYSIALSVIFVPIFLLLLRIIPILFLLRNNSILM